MNEVSNRLAERSMGIEVVRATKQFGDFTALDDVSLDVPDGSLTALLGPSGSGKSTLLRLIAGLEEPDSGQVLLGGRDVSGLPVQQRGIGFVFQHYAAFKHMTVRDNIAFGLTIKKTPRDKIRERVKELMELVQLRGLAHRYPSQLSGGQRQRMALARALAAEPRVLLLDEPFGALDATVRKELRSWLRRLHEEVHVTTIFVTHDQEEAMDVAEQIAVMNEGRIEQVGSPRALYEQPETEFVMSFVGEVNHVDGAFVRPHDLDLSLVQQEGTDEAMVERVTHLGFEVRVELALASGPTMWAQITRSEAEQLEIEPGQIVHARPSRARVFDERGPRTAELAVINGNAGG
jgi:sulfate/thiosulfate transport system ATP-binding protein